MRINSQNDVIGRVLLTRPGDKNEQLAQILSRHKIATLGRPMLEIVPLITEKNQQQLANLSCYDIVIAVSANAINLVKNNITTWPDNIEYYAIGATTAKQMLSLGLAAQSPSQPITESLLELTALQNIVGRHILILRGLGGRETLREQLITRGATVEYCEVYQRQVVNYAPSKELKTWYHSNIKTIVVTSGEILENLLVLITKSGGSWLFDCNLVVPSERVANLALGMGFLRCFVATGADHSAILQTLMDIQSRVNEKN